MSKASEIYKLLGGNKFAIMVSAKNFASSRHGLQFQIGKNLKRIKYIRVDHCVADIYMMIFLDKSAKEIDSVDDIFPEELLAVFSNVTGMVTSL